MKKLRQALLASSYIAISSVGLAATASALAADKPDYTQWDGRYGVIPIQNDESPVSPYLQISIGMGKLGGDSGNAKIDDGNLGFSANLGLMSDIHNDIALDISLYYTQFGTVEAESPVTGKSVGEIGVTAYGLEAGPNWLLTDNSSMFFHVGAGAAKDRKLSGSDSLYGTQTFANFGVRYAFTQHIAINASLYHYFSLARVANYDDLRWDALRAGMRFTF